MRGRRAVPAAGPRRGGAPGRRRRVGLREHGRRRRAALAPARPAVDLHGARGHRRLDADPPLLGRLHGVRPRLHALLRVPELLRVLHAAAGPGRQLLLPDRRLGVRRRGVLPADLASGTGARRRRRRASRRSSSTSSATSASCSAPTSSSSTTGTLDFLERVRRARSEFARNDGDLVAGCLLLLVGAFAKSAQVPLHTWLPDAMEGPTPVSALIHAATMVTAGVYLIARMHPLFEQAPTAADVGAIIGCVTLLIAATIAPRRDRPQARDRLLDDVADRLHDHGRLARSPTSAGLFHLMTHAFFKALLFMAAGSVIAAMAGEQNLDKMGGFQQRDAVHVRLHGDRRPGAGGRPAVRRLLLQGRDPRARCSRAAAGTSCSPCSATSARS